MANKIHHYLRDHQLTFADQEAKDACRVLSATTVEKLEALVGSEFPSNLKRTKVHLVYWAAKISYRRQGAGSPFRAMTQDELDERPPTHEVTVKCKGCGRVKDNHKVELVELDWVSHPIHICDRCLKVLRNFGLNALSTEDTKRSQVSRHTGNQMNL